MGKPNEQTEAAQGRRLQRAVGQQLTPDNKRKHMALVAECGRNTARGLMSESMAMQLIIESRSKLLANEKGQR